MHLSFPKFSITQDIPLSGDLRVPLDPLSKEDWDIPPYILDSGEISDDYLNTYKNRINMLNGIAKGRAVTTRANRKLQVDALKKALGMDHERDRADNDNNFDSHDDSDDKNDNNFDSRDDSDDRNNSDLQNSSDDRNNS